MAVTDARPCCGGKAHAPHKEGCTAPRKRSGPSGGQPRYRLPKELGEAAAECADAGLEAPALAALKLVLSSVRR